MLNEERILAVIYWLDRGWNYLALLLVVVAIAVWYDTHCYVNFSAPEAMDAAQVARNLSQGKGFTTDFIRPFSTVLLQDRHHASKAFLLGTTKNPDYSQVYGPHPDLANAPLYPLILAGLFKTTSPDWKINTKDPFWSSGGHFLRYEPEFQIALLNQFFLLAVVSLTFWLTRIIFDAPAAWLVSILMFASDALWKFSVSGLPIMLMLIIFLGLVWCLVAFEKLNQPGNPDQRRCFHLAVAAGVLIGLGMLTRYSFGWLILPVFIYFALFGGVRRYGYAVTAMITFGVVVTPWLIRNLAVSGTLFGTAGYAVIENSCVFPGSKLMQSLTPDMTSAHWIQPYQLKLMANLRLFMQDDVPRLGGEWMGILFLAGLLLKLHNQTAHRMRVFTLMCLGILLVISALGRTQWSILAPQLNAENMLILLTPMAVIFGVGFFLAMLNQMDIPALSLRLAVIIVVALLLRMQFIFTLLPPKLSPSAFPPYYPSDIQKISSWMKPGETVMSDIPWAMAWYGQQQCVWTTLNSQYEFDAWNDYIKPVNLLYLSLNTIDAHLFSECVQGSVDNWSNFGYKAVAFNQLPLRFPLPNFPVDSFVSGIVLSDQARW